MSSAASPALTLDLRPDWLVAAGFVCWSGTVLICLWQSEQAFVLCALLTVVVTVLVIQAVDSQLFGLSRRAPLGVRRTADGWVLRFRDGSDVRGLLQPSSRILPGGALLVFRSERGRHWLLLRAGPTNGTELRRLRVWMRLS